MIARLTGKLAEVDFTEVVIDVQGVGYGVSIPLSTYDKLPPVGGNVTLYTHFCMREDDIQLFGFATREERSLFRMLTAAVSGVGPKLALSVLSGISMDAFLAAVRDGDTKTLSKINGIGKRTAERIVLELKDKVDTLGVAAAPADSGTPAKQKRSQEVADAVAALETLGFKRDVAEKTIQKLSEELPNAATEVYIRRALAMLNS